MVDLVLEVVSWIFEGIFDGPSARRRRRRAERRMAEGYLRCCVRMVSGKIPGLTREGAMVELELAPGSAVCRRRDDQQRAIRFEDVTLDPMTERGIVDTDPYFSSDMAAVVWLLVMPSATLEVIAHSDVLLTAHALVHPEASPTPRLTDADTLVREVPPVP